MHAYGRVQRPRTGRLAEDQWVLATIDALWVNGGRGGGLAGEGQAGRGRGHDRLGRAGRCHRGQDHRAREGLAGELLAVIGDLWPRRTGSRGRYRRPGSGCRGRLMR